MCTRNVLLRGVGQMSLPIDGRVVREIAQLLAHLDTGGGTVTPGVSPISGRAATSTSDAGPGRRADRAVPGTA